MKKIIAKLKNNNIVKHMALSGLCKPLSLIINFIYIPIVLNFLGDEKYGVWATLLTIISWISYFDIGIGNGLRNKLTEAFSEGRYEDCRKLVTSAYIFISIIMAAILLIVSVVVKFVNWNKILGVSDLFNENLVSIIFICVMFVTTNFVLSICRNILYALQKASYVGVLEVATQLINLIALLIIRKFLNNSLFSVVLVYGISLISINILCSVILFSKNQNVRPSIKSIDLKMGKSLTTLGFKFFIVQICALILFSTDSLLISYLYGAVDVTPYSTVNKIFSTLAGVYVAFIAPIWSSFTKAKTENKIQSLNKMIKRLLLFMIPFCILAILITLFFKPITRIWLNKDLNYAYGLIPLGLAYCILTIWNNMYAAIGNGLELMKVSMIIAVLQASLNIPLSLFFAELLGYQSAGILAGTVIVMAISAIVMPIYIHKWINEKLVIAQTLESEQIDITDTDDTKTFEEE